MATGKSLSDEQNERLLVVVERVLETKFGGNASAMARNIGYKQGSFSQFLRGKAGGSLRLVEKMVHLGDEPESWFLHGVRPGPGERVVYDRPGRTAFWGDLPGWREAEQAARVQFMRRGVPDRAWEGARELAGAKPAAVNPQTAYDAAIFWLEHCDADPHAPKEKEKAKSKKK